VQGYNIGTALETENGFNPDIVFMYRMDHDFTDFTDEDKEYMESIRQRLFTLPLGDGVGDYLILNIARGLAGDMTKVFLQKLVNYLWDNIVELLQQKI
jgi:hypothetical protein